jgi:hypothetical protein
MKPAGRIATPNTPGTPLRFAVITKQGAIAPVYAQAVEALQAGGNAVCVAVIVLAHSKPDPVERLCDALFGIPSVLRLHPLPDSLGRLPRIPAERAHEIAALGADFLICCGGANGTTHLAGAAPHGIWAWCYGDQSHAGDPSVFWGVYRRSETITITLENLGPERFVLQRGVVNTDPTSLRTTLQTAVVATADFADLTVRYLRLHGELPRVAAAPRLPARRHGYGDVLTGAARMHCRWVAFQLRGTLLSEVWNVGVADVPIQDFLDPSQEPEIDWLPRFPQARFIADPFAIASGEGLELLVEEFDYDRYQGYITSIEYPLQPAASPAGRVLIDENIHMSYPFLVHHEGELYCVPECQQSRQVALYGYDRGQRRWTRQQTLLEDFAALDASILRHEGRWYLFCTCQDDYPECKLYIWHSPALAGPWAPHALNPVKCDVRSSRPGGTFFAHAGALYRPAQNSSRSYGGSLAINRIMRLSSTEFEEVPVAHLEPRKGYWRDGIHTLSSAGAGRTVLDGKRMALLPGLAIRRLRHKLKRMLSLLRPARRSMENDDE